jgi:hypothetical protein
MLKRAAAAGFGKMPARRRHAVVAGPEKLHHFSARAAFAALFDTSQHAFARERAGHMHRAWLEPGYPITGTAEMIDLDLGGLCRAWLGRPAQLS